MRSHKLNHQEVAAIVVTLQMQEAAWGSSLAELILQHLGQGCVTEGNRMLMNGAQGVLPCHPAASQSEASTCGQLVIITFLFVFPHAVCGSVLTAGRSHAGESPMCCRLFVTWTINTEKHSAGSAASQGC